MKVMMETSRSKKQPKPSVISLESLSPESSVNYQLSAAYVSDAIEGRFYKAGLGKNLEQNRKASVWFLRITSHFMYTMFLFVVSFFHCTLSALEHTQMIGVECESLNDIAFWGGIACCCFYVVDIVLILSYSGPRQYFAFIHGRLYVFFVFLISIDYLLFLTCNRMIFRLLRPMLLIFRIPALRRIGLVMLGVTPKFLQFLLIMGVCVTIFAAIGVHLFMYTYIDGDVVKRQHDEIYVGAFNHVGIAILEVFVLMAGGSYPRFMIPAYVEYGPVVISFFITIILIGEIILYGILVAKIYDFYIEANKSHVKGERYYERQCLIKAFEILDTDNSGSVSFSQWKGLMRIIRPKASTSEIMKRFRKLKDLSKKKLAGDETHADSFHQSMSLIEFFYLPNVLQFTVEKSTIARTFDINAHTRNTVQIYAHMLYQKLVLACRTWYNTRFAFYVSLVLNILFLTPFTLIWWGVTSLQASIAFLFESILLIIISLEVIAQFIALGYKYMFQEMLLHVVMVVAAAGCLTYSRVTNYDRWNVGWPPVLAYLCMAIRLIGFKRKSSSTFHWLRRIAPPFFTLLCLTVIAFYTYGVLGMECFGYLGGNNNNNQTQNVLPEGISVCKYGFETIGCSLLTLFQISLGSSWHKVMHFIMSEVSNWSSVYFVFFYAFMQMLVLNIISAIMVELTNAISIDENEAKQRDKEFETRDETKRPMYGGRGSFLSPDVLPKRNSFENASVLATISTTTGFVTPDQGFLSPAQVYNFTPSSPNFTEETQSMSRFSKNFSSATALKQFQLPCVVEEDLEIENVDEDENVTLPGRKELGNWTRDILPDLTFYNPEELKRLYKEMGKSVKHAKSIQGQRKRISINNRVMEAT